ncbi:MAG: type II secretion system F family protein [Proteobacteria bacterium]|nr:type II secretion system F family protein [Pseudomonadota bacterium]
MDFNFLGLELIDVITILAGVFAFLAVLVAWNATLSYNPIGKRLKLLQERREILKAGIVSRKRRTTQIKKTQKMGFMSRFLDKFNLLRSGQTEKITVKLVQAGYRNNDALVAFMFGKAALPFLMVGVSLTMIYGLDLFQDNTWGQTGFGLALVLFGFYLPNILVTNVATKRAAAIQKALPDALDLMVICAEAGLTLDASLSRVSREMMRQSEELADEFGLASIELGFLADRRQALINLTERVPLKSIRGVVATLVQTEKYGTPLAHSLRVLSHEFRNERMMKAEEKAARLPAIMTIPLIMFILPMLFIILLGPAACSISDNLIAVY